jgi:hypothetical protein
MKRTEGETMKINLNTLNVAIEDLFDANIAVHKYADPVEGARENLTLDEAVEVAREDSGLLYVDSDDLSFDATGRHLFASPIAAQEFDTDCGDCYPIREIGQGGFVVTGLVSAEDLGNRYVVVDDTWAVDAQELYGLLDSEELAVLDRDGSWQREGRIRAAWDTLHVYGDDDGYEFLDGDDMVALLAAGARLVPVTELDLAGGER